MRHNLSPSILAAKLLDLPKVFAILNKYPISSIHIDIMDGQFVNNITYGPAVVEEIRKLSTIPFYGHLMVLNPENLIVEFMKAGIDLPIFHIEATSNSFKLIHIIKNNGKKVGIAINPDTTVEKLFPFLNMIDVVLVMTVNPGFYGQGIIMQALNKIKNIKEKNKNLEIIIDGGVKLSNLKDVLQYNPNTIVSSSEIFLSTNIEKTLEQFLKILS